MNPWEAPPQPRRVKDYPLWIRAVARAGSILAICIMFAVGLVLLLMILWCAKFIWGTL